MLRNFVTALAGLYTLAIPALVSAQSDAAAEGKYLTNIRQLTMEGVRAGEGYFSPDGKHMIFQSERDAENPFYQIFLLDLETGDSRRMSPGTGKTTCSWIHPSMTKVLFASTHEDPQAVAKQKAELAERASGKQRRYSWDYDENYDLFEVPWNGGPARNLTHARGYDAEGSYSPDGTKIAFASNRHAYAGKLSKEEQARLEHDPSWFIDIYIMDADGKNVRRLTNTPGYDGGPFFSPDGKRIVWRRFSEDGAVAEVFTMNLDGSSPKQLTRLGAMSWAPYFHPSGDYVIFGTNLNGFANFELYIVDAAGERTPVRITYTEGFDSLPVFTPDGKRLAWTSSRTPNKKAQIFYADWNDTAARAALAAAPIATPAASGRKAAKAGSQAARGRDISAAELEAHVKALASTEFEGRLTGTDGERKAVAYVADAFKRLGLRPAGDANGYEQSFEFTAGMSLGADNSAVLRASQGKPAAWKLNEDWRPLTFSQVGEEKGAPVVFAGYGINAPAVDGNAAYNSYADQNVQGKWVMVFRYVPESSPPAVRQHLGRYATLRQKAMVARELGARGLLVVSGPNAAVKDELVPLTTDAALGNTRLLALSISNRAAEALVARSGQTLKAMQSAVDDGVATRAFVLKDVEVAARVDLRQEKRIGHNAIGRLQWGAAPTPQVLMIGAHVDHLGRGEGTNSLARDDEKGQIHYGADDNASGVAGMLEMARYLSALKSPGFVPKRDVVFAAWSGEELGLLGSAHFVNHHPSAEKLGKTVFAYLNLDMVGRLDKTLVLQGVGSSSVWPRLIEKRNVPLGLPITLTDDSHLPTDATSFYLKGVPILAAFTGAHGEYHTPRDTPDRLNYAGEEKIVKLMAALAKDLVARETPLDYRHTQPPARKGRGNVRVTLGTIPDYAQGNTKGVKISGTVKGGPAEKAGLLGGDVLVELNGKKIENIYDYMFILENLKAGQNVPGAVVRGAQRKEFTISPAPRE